ncbi:hypothetical protein HPC49_42890 [Pyxidicoccus fallax]|uniref:Lipoprotein n=1 Tax=Pyxidicoccus fallax TaxID=394095 RepID=A0A848LYW0_9BACT|nr:hypothetical protein [Pyxidicoccus fallax]NMO22811.1 hypothetical protein [Pyxidicoccus fallax]NPC84953.1 hypothetical protein [Pyxidicoccus fallax]
MHPVGRLGGLLVGLGLFVGCGGPEPREPAPSGAEALETVESAVYEAPDSLLGLVGSYTRYWPPAAAGELTSMTLTGTEYVDRVEGSYVRTVSRVCPIYGCNTETGGFWALPNNPAVGALIVFKDLAGAERDYYAITQIQRSTVTGNITGIVLVKGGSVSPVPFTMTRVGF